MSGSGVVISAKGEILTNAHVVEECQKIYVKLASGNPEAALLVTRDERNDLAVIRLASTNSPLTSVAAFRDGSLVRAGDAIVALGYPLSGVLATSANLSVGYVSALAGLGDDSRYLQISAPVQPGNSGGPLLDASGHLVGIVTAKLNAISIARFTGDIPENVNFALKAEVARTFLDSKAIAYQTARSDNQLTPADVGDIARPFTVHIECEQSRPAGVASITSPGRPPPVRAPAAAPPVHVVPNQDSVAAPPTPPVSIGGYYGAAAAGIEGSHVGVVYSTNYRSPGAADAKALQECSTRTQNCQIVTCFWNGGCGYITTASSRGTCYGYGPTPDIALSQCQARGCACNTPVGGCTQ